MFSYLISVKYDEKGMVTYNAICFTEVLKDPQQWHIPIVPPNSPFYSDHRQYWGRHMFLRTHSPTPSSEEEGILVPQRVDAAQQTDEEEDTAPKDSS